MFDAASFIGKVKTLISDANATTTSATGISYVLQLKVRSFYNGVEGLADSLPIPKTFYPAVVVELSSKSEDFWEVGNSARRKMDVRFNIVSITDFGAGTTTPTVNAQENAMLEAVKLSQNIEGLIRTKTSLSLPAYVLFCNVESTEYGVTKREEIYNAMVRTKCVAQIMST